MTNSRKYPLFHNTVFFKIIADNQLLSVGVYQLSFLHMLRNLLVKGLYSVAITADTYVLHVNPAYLLPINYFFRNNFNTRFDLLTDIAAMDTLYGKSRFFVCYNYLSTFYNSRVLIKVRVPDCDALQSIILIYQNANWLEREAWDMFGIYFHNHPDLRRILTDYGFEAHPLRKDFPLTGYKEVKYSETRKMVIRCKVSLAQEYRTYQFNNPWRSSNRFYSTRSKVYKPFVNNNMLITSKTFNHCNIKKKNRRPLFSSFTRPLSISQRRVFSSISTHFYRLGRTRPSVCGPYATNYEASKYFNEFYSVTPKQIQLPILNNSVFTSFFFNYQNKVLFKLITFFYTFLMFFFFNPYLLLQESSVDISKILNFRRIKYKLYTIYHKFKNFILPIFDIFLCFCNTPWLRRFYFRQWYNKYILSPKQWLDSLVFRTRLFLIFFYYRQVRLIKTYFYIIYRTVLTFLQNRKVELLVLTAILFYWFCIPAIKTVVNFYLHSLKVEDGIPVRYTNMPLYLILHFLTIFLMIAYYTLLERKVMASIQRRKGPNVNGAFGLLQPLADGGKLLLKEMIMPVGAVKSVFLCSPVLSLTVALSLWALMPFSSNVVGANLTYSVLAFFIFSGLSIYGVIFAGWSSNSKYPLMGSLRSVAQMISYEVVLGFILLIISMLTGSLNFIDIVNYQKESIWLIVPCFPVFAVYFIVILAETNRAPFDLAEAESELVAGYNTEYSGILFAMFFLAEYSNMIILSAAGSALFLGGWHGPFYPAINFAIKTILIMILIVVVRAVSPRYRYDQLMSLGWRSLLPLTMALFLFYASFFYHYDSFYCGSQYPVDFVEYHLALETTIYF